MHIHTDTHIFVHAFIYHSVHWYFADSHDDAIKWKHFPRYWSFVRGIPPSQVLTRSGAFMFSLICAWINSWVNKQFSKQSYGSWSEMTSHSLWRHCNVNGRGGQVKPLLFMRVKLPWSTWYPSITADDIKRWNTIIMQCICICICFITHVLWNADVWCWLWIKILLSILCMRLQPDELGQ